MRKQLLVLGVVGLSAIATLAQAADHKQPVSKWTCEDFLAVNEKFQPAAVGFAEALNKNGKPEEAVMDVDGTVKITPMVIEACKKDPSSSFSAKLKSIWSDVKKDV